jgi:hypothetical protein
VSGGVFGEPLDEYAMADFLPALSKNYDSILAAQTVDLPKAACDHLGDRGIEGLDAASGILLCGDTRRTHKEEGRRYESNVEHGSPAERCGVAV